MSRTELEQQIMQIPCTGDETKRQRRYYREKGRLLPLIQRQDADFLCRELAKRLRL